MRSHIKNQGLSKGGIFFLVGRSDLNDKRTTELISEMDQFSDFIIGNYIDSYRNLTLKTLSGYKYVHDNCPISVKWILMQDDDTIIKEMPFQKFLSPPKELTACFAEKWSHAAVI